MAQVARRNTRQRQLVLDEVRSRRDHPTAEQIYESVHQVDDRLSRATVYRNLHLLADSGLILSIKTPGEEHFDLRTDMHPHIVCMRCGRMEDVPKPEETDLEQWHQAQRDIDARATAALRSDAVVQGRRPWQLVSHSMVFYGICPECAAKEQAQG